VLLQFLAEAVFMSVAGIVIGILVSQANSLITAGADCTRRGACRFVFS
jgi:ABC-type antimicrobial peptide transport system permease subunit